MKTVGINEFNDIYLDESNNLAIKSNLDAMGDIFINKSQTNKGELQFSDKGIDFFNNIFSSPAYPDLYQNELINQLENTAETQQVENFDQTQEKDIYNYQAKIITSYGEVILNG